jgi:hypothetical protein
MTSVHSVRPTDLVALVAYDGRVYPNEAITRDRIGTEASPHLLETALEQWLSFATARHTWISVKGATLRGLVSTRRRGSRAAWEIDCLIDAAEDDAGVLTSLIERMIGDAGRAGAEKVFLRVPAASDAVERARHAGFCGYTTERLLARRGGEASASPAVEGMRRWTRADAEPAFRLYNRWAPQPVRRVEAATYREWLAAQERLTPARGTRQRVVERNGRIAGWLRTAAAGEVGRFDLMADPAQPALLDGLTDTALTMLGEQSRVFTLVPEFAPGLRERLEQRGFAVEAEYALLARPTTQRAELPALAQTSVA